MLSPRRALVASTLTGLVAVTVVSTGFAAHPTSGAARPATPHIVLRNDLRTRLASRTGPLSTAQCEKLYRLACYEPAQFQKAYDEKPLLHAGIDGRGQTIVIVDPFGSPTMAHDLGVFDRAFGLPDPPSFQVITPAGPVNRQNAGWAGETTLDVEWSHAMAPGANILLVETPKSEDEGTSGFAQIVTAEKYVIDHHLGGVISQSFGATEETFPTPKSLYQLRGAYLDAAVKGVSVLAASGDAGAADVGTNGNFYLEPVTSWPTSDPLVTAVGGTALQLDSQGNRVAPDVVWNETDSVPVNDFFGSRAPDPAAGGGGLSALFPRPPYQDAVKSVVGNQRGVPDISMSAACDGAVDTYQSYPGEAPGWYLACGTSEASPIFAGIVALADQVAGHPLGNLNPALYAMARQKSHGRAITDVVSGSTTVSFRQGGLKTVVGAQAVPGYDIASGVGTVDVATFVPDLVRFVHRTHGS